MSVGEYFMSVVCASVIAALVGLIYPDDKGGVRKTLDLCISLFLLCVIIAPIGALISNAKENSDIGGNDLVLPDKSASADSAIYSSLAKASGEDISARLREVICNRTGISKGEIVVEADVRADGNGVVIERITVWLYGKAMWSDPEEIRELVAEYTESECLIVNGG